MCMVPVKVASELMHKICALCNAIEPKYPFSYLTYLCPLWIARKCIQNKKKKEQQQMESVKRTEEK